MAFSKILNDLMTNVPGIIGAAVMAVDGLSLEIRSADRSPDIEVIGAELAVSFRSFVKGIEDVEAGKFQELVVRYDSMTYLVRFLSPEYFALLALGPEAVLGQARFHLRKAAARLTAEL